MSIYISISHSLFYSSLFTKSAETPINTGVASGEEWRTTLHHSSPLFTWIFYSSDYAELTEHSCSTDYAQILNGRSTCSVFEESPTDLAFPSAADFQSTDFHRFSGWRVVKSGEEWRATLHPCKFLSYRHLCHSCEEWRVFLKLYGQSFSGKVLEIRR